MCVVAGPGSGKTRVLVERFRWLVTAKGVPVRRILAITFTEKAAANMRQRLVEAFPPASPERKAVERAYISTIHAFCARLLRENAVEAAVDPEFRVLDEWEADFELRRAIDEALEAEYRRRPERVRAFLAAFAGRDVPGALYTLFQALRAAGVTVEESRRSGVAPDPDVLWREVQEALRRAAALPTTGWRLDQRQALQDALAQDPASLTVNLSKLKAGGQRELLKRVRDELLPAWRAADLLRRHASEREWFLDALALASRLYDEAKRASGALDYADLEEGAIRLLQSSGGRRRSDFSFILMDEFQDTNPLQARLVSLLRSPGNFFAVGDINQSIYGFRHADPAVFREFRERTRETGGLVVELHENFRSRPEILAAVRRITCKAEGIEPQELRSGRDDFVPAPGPSLEVLTVQAPEGDEASRREARHLAARIRALAAGGSFSYGDIAVLLRTSAQVRLVEKTLREHGVPCEVTEGRGFYEAREVWDLLAFLRIMVNPRDEISLAAVLRSPFGGIDDDTLLRLKLDYGSLAEGVAAVDVAKVPALAAFRRLFEGFRRRQDDAAIDRLLSRLLAATGYEAWLLTQPNGPHRSANVRKLMALARRFRAGGVVSLRQFLDRVDALRRDEARESDARPPGQSADAVQVMTIHAAKGLEFPVVFVASVSRGGKSDTDPVVFLPGLGVGLRWRDPRSGDDRPDAVAVAVSEELERRQKEEEQRLFYVAMTRAQRLLVLSAAFGANVQARHWSRLLQDNLEVDLKTFDNAPRDVALADVRFHLLQTDQEPALDGPAPPARSRAAEPVLLNRAVVEDQSDAVVSATSVVLFAQCPRQYYLSRYLGFPAVSQSRDVPSRDREGADDDTDPSEFGREVHALLAGTLPSEQASSEVQRLSVRFHASDLGRRAAAAPRAQREQGFLVSLDGRLLSGRIDLWFRDAAGAVLIDYKTDQVTAAQAPERAADYALQLSLYALALERLAGAPPDRAVLYFLRPDLPVDVPLDPAVARSAMEALHQAQSRLEFPLRVGAHCRRCPHLGGLCPAEPPAGDAPEG